MNQNKIHIKMMQKKSSRVKKWIRLPEQHSIVIDREHGPPRDPPP